MLDLMSAFSKVAQYKIKIQKSVVLLYTYNEFSKNQKSKCLKLSSIRNKKIEYI